ncbi:hypothetical protein Hypma_014920 [Hypsizygus marmoreus]|uniref:Uncharacterized protein n=1 Tax=Hypsizygus marmoreus TaxID=39966 RepID=A0A369K3Y1_HYPMA|nr:hypothetical protein Hypma_014920 [Hypsizygus marmoreus]
MAQELPDFKQVSALFNDCIAVVRSRPLENLDAAAEEWIQAARLKVMRDIEAKFTIELVAGITIWPAKRTVRWRRHRGPWSRQRLSAYIPQTIADSPAFITNLDNLMRECGFHASVMGFAGTFYVVNITFPARVAPRSARGGRAGRSASTIQQLSTSISRIRTRAITAGPIHPNGSIITEPDDEGDRPSGGIGQRVRENRQASRRAIEAPPKAQPAGSTEPDNGPSGSIAERVRGKRRVQAESDPTVTGEETSEDAGQQAGASSRTSRRRRVNGNAGITKRKRK